jgi:hypothetical protein
MTQVVGQLRLFSPRIITALLVALACCAPLQTAYASAPTATATVTNTNDNGDGSLRSAITYLNSTAGGSVMFNIPTSDPGYDSTTGVFTIAISSQLELNGGDMTVDGATQTAFTGDTNPLGPEIEVANGGNSVYCALNVFSSDNAIKGLIVSGTQEGILLRGPSGNTVSSCYIGTDASGRNVSPNNGFPNTLSYGIFGYFGHDDTIGGLAAGDGNIIGFASKYGIELAGVTGTNVSHNKIISNGAGIELGSGGTAQIADNSIIGSSGAGVIVLAFNSSATIQRNIITSGGGLPIDLGNDGVTPNDGTDGVNDGPDGSQNFPVITGTAVAGNTTTVSGTLDTSANGNFTIDLYGTDAANADSAGHGQADYYLGSVTAISDGAGHADWTLSVDDIAGATVCATATNTDEGWTSELSQNFIINSPPTNVGVTPSGGSSSTGAPVSFTAVYDDTDGSADIITARCMIAEALSGGHSLYGYYNAVGNKLYLFNDAGNGIIGGFAPGSNNVISNSQGSLNCAATTVTSSGDSLTVNWNFTPSANYGGAKNLYLLATDAAVTSSPWQNLGSWTFVAVNSPPINLSVTPSSSSSNTGIASTLTAVYSDANGGSDITAARCMVSGSLSAGHSLYGYFDRRAYRLYLFSDDGRVLLGGFSPGTANTITNSQGSLNCGATTIALSGNTLTVNWNFTPAPGYGGSKNVYLGATDTAGANSSWQSLGTWNIITAPVPISVTPSSGSSAAGTARTLTATYVDANGATDIATARLMVSGTLSNKYSLYGYYDCVANRLYLFNDLGKGLIGGFAPGTANTITNSQGSLNCEATSVTKNANNLTVNWNFTPSTGYTGDQNLFLAATNGAGANSSWQTLGTWTVTASGQEKSMPRTPSGHGA